MRKQVGIRGTLLTTRVGCHDIFRGSAMNVFGTDGKKRFVDVGPSVTRLCNCRSTRTVVTAVRSVDHRICIRPGQQSRLLICLGHFSGVASTRSRMFHGSNDAL